MLSEVDFEIAYRVTIFFSICLLTLVSTLFIWHWFSEDRTQRSLKHGAHTSTPSDPHDWNIEHVCEWLNSLGSVFTSHLATFRSHGVSGRVLLTEIDENTLIDLGVAIGAQRKRILNAIDTLKHIKSFVETQLDTPFYKAFTGDFCPPSYLKLQHSSEYKNILSCNLLDQQQPEHVELLSKIHTWLGILPTGHKVDKIEFVFNPARYRMFLSQLLFIENRAKQSLFQPDLLIENSIEERLKVLEQLAQLSRQVYHNREAQIVRMWHGCSPKVLSQLLSDGFTTISSRDEGWLGRGMYFTSSAKYATQYSEKHGCLIMSYVLILNPFPIVSSDAPVNAEPSQFRFNGQGNYKTYQCHYAPVAPISYEARYLDNRPPATGHDDAVFDELVVFQQADILPQVVVHLQQ